MVSAAGTVLAYCEARKGDSGDWGTIDVMLRRSTDGGKTWHPRRRLVHVEGDLAALPDGRLLCFYERGSTDGENHYRPGRLTVARFDEEWVRARP